MNTTAPLTVIGAGGFGRETLDVALASGRRVLGVVDDAPTTAALRACERLGVRYLGRISDWLPTAAGQQFVVAVGTPAVRARLDAAAVGAGAVATTLVHPSASIGSAVELGRGAVVCAHVTIGSGVRSGRHLHCNPGSVVGHDAVLGHHVSVNPRAAISGDVHVADRALVGAGAVVLQGLTVGADALVGAAAAVTRDVPADTTVVGVPARPLRPASSPTHRRPEGAS